MRTTHLLAPLALTAVLLTGCSAAEDKAKEVAGDAACSLAAKAVSGVKGQVDDAVTQIGADPEAAQRKLTGLRDGVKSAEGRVSGDVKAQLTEAREALDDLVAQASDAAEGADVDTSAIDTSKQHFSDAVDDVSTTC